MLRAFLEGVDLIGREFDLHALRTTIRDHGVDVPVLVSPLGHVVLGPLFILPSRRSIHIAVDRVFKVAQAFPSFCSPQVVSVPLHITFHIITMKFSALVSLASTAAIALAAPTTPASALSKRADFCGQWDSTTTGVYTVYNNLWGSSAATSGSQCTGVDGLSGSTLKWHTKWSWAGGYVSPTTPSRTDY